MLRTFAAAAALLVAALGLVVLVGWSFDMAMLKSVFPPWVSMKPNTAVAFVLSGISLWLLVGPNHDPWSPRRRASVVCAIGTIGIGAMTMIEYAAGAGSAFDELLVRDPTGELGNATPGRMAPQAALAFILVGTALLSLRAKVFTRLVEGLLHLALFAISLVSITSYAYNVPSLEDALGFPRIAIHTAVGFIALSAGMLAARGADGIVGVLTSTSAAGRVARRLLPGVIIVPLLFGWLRLKGQLAGLYGPEFGLAIGSAAGVLVFVTLVWWGAASLEHAEHARQETRAALLNSETRYRRLFTQAAIPLYRTTPRGVFLDTNPALLQLLGVPYSSTLIGTSTRAWYAREEDHDTCLAALARDGFIRDQPIELRRLDGKTIWVLATTRRVRDVDTGEASIEGGLVDITERRIAENLLAASERRFRALIEHNGDGIALLSCEGTVLYHSPAVLRILGRRPEERVGHSFIEIVHPDDLPYVQATMDRVKATEGEFASIEVRLRHGDGSWRWVESGIANLLHDPSVGALVANYRDITQRKESEAALRESDERFREMAEHITEAFFVIDVADSRPLYVSPPWAEIWGRPLDEAYDPRGWDRMVHADDRGMVTASQMRIRSGEANEATYRIIRPDSSIRWVRRRAFPVATESGEVHHVVGVAEDITELRDTQERLAHSNKMEAIGRLAGGVAHDFNNLLTVIMAETHMLQSAIGAEQRAQESLAEIRRASDSAVTLTRQLLTFSRKQPTEFVVFDLNEHIRNTVSVLRRLIGENIHLDLKLMPDTGLIRADKGQVQQVLTNLVVNARDAMPAGGLLTIATSRKDVPEGTTSNADLPAGEYLVITVRDTGVGMTPDVRARAFEPFFTTKDFGRGSGFGLATTHGIIKQTGGAISLESEPNAGTTFRIVLPRVVNEGVTPIRAPDANAPEGTETILIVEDEEAVRRIGAQLLRTQGYHVLEARDGFEAIRILREYDRDIALCFTDLVLPGVDGGELARRVRIMRPSMKILYTTGYSSDVLQQQNIETEDATVLTKPYSRTSLSQRVRTILDH